MKKKIEDYIEVRKETTSAVSVTIFDGTNDIASVIYGDANTKDNIKADKDTVYEWGSISKMLVWTSVMQLYEQGKIDLNADVRTYLPDGFLSNLSLLSTTPAGLKTYLSIQRDGNGNVIALQHMTGMDFQKNTMLVVIKIIFFHCACVHIGLLAYFATANGWKFNQRTGYFKMCVDDCLLIYRNSDIGAWLIWWQGFNSNCFYWHFYQFWGC